MRPIVTDMTLIRKYFGIVAINAAFSVAALFLANLYLDYLIWEKSARIEERQQIENAAREIDAAYFNQCLSKDHIQFMYPDLVSSRQNFRDLAEETGFLPLGSVPYEKTAYCNEGYGFVTFQSDRYGFRNDDSRWEKPVDVLVIGDSFGQGACVPEQYVFSNQIAADLGVNAVNVATGSNSPVHYRALIDVFVPMVKPRFAILVFFTNDNVAVQNGDPYASTTSQSIAKEYSLAGVSSAGYAFYKRVRPLLTPSSVASSSPIDCTNIDLSYPDKSAAIVANYARGRFSTISNYLERLSVPDQRRGLLTLGSLWQSAKKFTNLPASHQPIVESPFATTAALQALFRTCTDYCQPVIVMLPSSAYWRPDNRTDTYYKFVADEVARLTPQVAVPILDVRTIIDNDKISNYAPLGPHFSTEAYRQVGINLGKLIKTHH